MIFETHAHYDDARFDTDRDVLLAGMRSAGVGKIVNVGADFQGCQDTLALAEHYENVYAALGIHPSDIGDLTEEHIRWIEEHASHRKVVAIGEIGLDYYWDKDPQVQQAQREGFLRQMELARRTGLPVIIHSRDAAADTVRLMREIHAEQIPGVIHCYSYSSELAREFVKMGYYIGVGGVVTFKNAKKLKDTVAEVGLEHILLETDCPYMAPEPHRGERNDSRNIRFVAETIAELTGTSREEVEAVTWENACRFYGLEPIYAGA